MTESDSKTKAECSEWKSTLWRLGLIASFLLPVILLFSIRALLWPDLGLRFRHLSIEWFRQSVGWLPLEFSREPIRGPLHYVLAVVFFVTSLAFVIRLVLTDSPAL